MSASKPTINERMMALLEKQDARLAALEEKIMSMSAAVPEVAPANTPEVKLSLEEESFLYLENAAAWNKVTYGPNDRLPLASEVLEYAVSEDFSRGILVLNGRLPSYSSMYAHLKIDEKAEKARNSSASSAMGKAHGAYFHVNMGMTNDAAIRLGADVVALEVKAPKGASLSYKVLNVIAATILETNKKHPAD